MRSLVPLFFITIYNTNVLFYGDKKSKITGYTPVLTVRVQTNNIDTTDCAVTVRLKEYYDNKYTDLSEMYTWCDDVNGSNDTCFINLIIHRPKLSFRISI